MTNNPVEEFLNRETQCMQCGNVVNLQYSKLLALVRVYREANQNIITKQYLHWSEKFAHDAEDKAKEIVK